MSSLVLGPILRHVGPADATVWLETDAPCTVEVLGHRAETFTVDGHHYAIVVVEGLEPGTAQPYEVALDGRRAWPPPDSPLPPSAIRTPAPGAPLELAFGSCRSSLPHEPPWLQTGGPVERGHGIDALRALARQMATGAQARWPHHLLMLGDQLYADQLSPRMRERTGGREMRCDFDEYAAGYREAWSDPLVRWMLSVLPSSMIFDDHEIRAQWKISAGWLRRMRRHEHYDRRIVGGLSAYWVYQQLGNLSPAELRRDDTFRRVREAGDATAVLRELAVGADRQAGHSRWSFCRDLGRSRLVVIDSRAGRELGDARRMIDQGEWRWIAERADVVLLSGDVHHCYLADVRLPRLGDDHPPIWQAVCSPYRKRLAPRERQLMRAGMSRPARALARRLARAVGVAAPAARWRVVEPPSYDNQLGLLRFGADGARLRVATTVGSTWREPALHERFARRLT